MIAKILMCECVKKNFQSESCKYIKKIIHYHCKCKEKHLYFTIFCKEHPFRANFSSNQEERKCTCTVKLSQEVCQFCCNIRYLLNFKYFKICVEQIPENLQKDMQALDQYVNEINCQPFFAHNKKSNSIEIHLDNPSFPKFPINTDHFYNFSA